MTWYCFALSGDLFSLGGMLFFVGLGCTIMGYTLWRIVEGRRAARWPHTTGMVLSLGSRINAEQDREVVVRYSYSVGDRTYEGSRVHPVFTGLAVEDEVARKAMEAALTPGTKVRVHYSADDPARSAMVVGFFSASLPLVFMGAGFAVLPLCFLVTAAIGEADGTVASVAGTVVFVVAAIGFLICWSLTLWFATKGNRNIAAGIIFEK